MNNINEMNDNEFAEQIIGGMPIPKKYTMQDAKTDIKNMGLKNTTAELHERMHEYMNNRKENNSSK